MHGKEKTFIDSTYNKEDTMPMPGECIIGGEGRYNMHENQCSLEEKGWTPIHTTFQWCDSQICNQLTLLVVMPSGVNLKYTVAITGGGTKIELGVEWPEMSCDPTKLHEPFQKIMEMKKSSGGVDTTTQDFITKVQEFEKHMSFFGEGNGQDGIKGSNWTTYYSPCSSH